MRKFDFENPLFKKHSPAVQEFMRKAFKSGMSENAFVQRYKTLPRPKSRNGRLKSKRGRRSPSHLRDMYRGLKRKYNFF